MKNTLLLCLLLTASSFLFSQDNPYEKYGFKPKVATMTNGKFIEIHDRDTIVQIGRIVYNTMSKEIIGFVEYDTAYSEATLAPDIVSRWLSPDPLQHMRLWVSPYNFVQNNPIMKIDPDGRLDGDYFDKQGNHLGSDGIDDGKIHIVEGTSKFSISDFQSGGKYFENHQEFAKNNGGGFSVREVGSDSELGNMIRTVFAEAAGQSSESKLAVAEVIRNRATDNTAPSASNKYTAQFSNVNTYSEVVNQRGQFESVQSGAPRFTTPLSVTSGNILEQRAFVGSASAAIKAHYQGTNTADGALFFYSPYIKAPNWTTVLESVTVSGNSSNDFLFYKYK